MHTCMDTLWIDGDRCGSLWRPKIREKQNDTKTGSFWLVFHTNFSEWIPWRVWIPFDNHSRNVRPHTLEFSKKTEGSLPCKLSGVSRCPGVHAHTQDSIFTLFFTGFQLIVSTIHTRLSPPSRAMPGGERRRACARHGVTHDETG